MEEDVQYPWVEEFRPQKVSDIIGDSEIIDKMKQFETEKSIPNLLLIGHAGTGKTTIAKVLANTICGKNNYLYINASERNNIDTVRTDILNYCGTASFDTNIKIIILDEFGGMTIQAQRSLKAVMEEYSKNTRFILTENSENKIIDPIKSRCQRFDFTTTNKAQIAKRCYEILNTKKIKLKGSKEDVINSIKKLVNDFYPDIRLTIQNLQKFSLNGEFNYNNVSIVTNSNLIEFIKKYDVKSIREQILKTTTDYSILYNYIFENVKNISTNSDKICAIILLISEYMYRHTTHINSEINFIACILEIINILKE